MPDGVATLESPGSKLPEEFLGLGDLRPGLPYRGHAPQRQAVLPLRQTQRSQDLAALNEKI
jgi:hypothetical protein